MSKEENKDYYRINEPDKEDPESEMATGEKRSKKKLIIIISVIVVVVAAITALLLILLLKKDDNSLPSGYNGFVLKQNKNLKYAYWARINRENDVSVPIEFGSNNKEFVEADFSICMYSDRTYRISYTPTQNAIGSNDTRWTVPDELLERKGCDNTKLLSFGDFSVDQNPFGFTLKNPAHKNTFWLSTKDRNLVLSDKYIECGFEIHSQQVFGWGERTRDFMLVPGEYSIWNTGIEKKADPGKLGYNTFGDHPFVLARLTDKTYLGLFFKNSNAKVLKYSHESQGRSIINFRAVGGIIDIFAFMGSTADEILGEFHKIIGEPILPPLWAFGFHQGSNGYINDSIARKSVENYAKENIPLEALWIDESLMDKYRLFTIDKTNFGNIKTLQRDLEKNHQFLGISLHPGISVNGSDGKPNPYFIKGKENKAFITASKNSTIYDNILIGEHLGGKSAYFDFNLALNIN